MFYNDVAIHSVALTCSIVILVEIGKKIPDRNLQFGSAFTPHTRTAMDNCAECGYNTKRSAKSYRNRRFLCGKQYDDIRKCLMNKGKQNISESSVLCCKCLTKYLKRKNLVSECPLAPPLVSVENHVSLENVRSISTHSVCVVCRKPVKKGCTRVPKLARIDLLVNHRCHVGESSNICIEHLQGNRLKHDIVVFSSNRNVSDTQLTSKSSSSLISSLLDVLKTERASPYLDFSDPSLTDDDFKVWTGWTKSQLTAMHQVLKQRGSCKRSSIDTIAMFWIKLKTNLSFNQIASLFNLGTDAAGRMVVSRAFHSVAEQLNANFVPFHLGVEHISRQDAMEHMTTFSNMFFDYNLVTIWDGTYYYIEKSNQYDFSRKTWSGQKKRPLLKFMSIVFPDGYVLDSIGPYLSDGKNNDAGITQHIMSLNTELENWMEEGDVCVVDRGFRDVIETFESKGLECKMPSYLQKGVSQHSIEEANQSRLVTKVRWVVEAYHGRMKKFKFFDDVIDHSFLPVLGHLNNIVSAALNAFRPPLSSPSPDDVAIATKMLSSSSDNQNALAEKVEKGSLSSRGRWVSIDHESAVPLFPHLTLSCLRSITCGVYQLKQAKSYTREHFDHEGQYKIELHKEAENIIRIRIQSRHVGSKRYFLWVEYNGESVNAWYCQCKAGMRTVGCCAHVASVIWYLGFARHNSIEEPRRKKRTVALNAAER